MIQTQEWQVSGLVQGVGFRWTTLNLAKKLAICGSVKNLPDGSVQIIAQGRSSQLEAFHTALADSASFAQISNIDVKILSHYQPLTDFKVLY